MACIRSRIRITDEAMVDVHKALAPGIRQIDLSAGFLRRAFELGATASMLEPIWQVMPHSKAEGVWTTHGDLALPLLSTERELAEGDVLWTDVSITYRGYCSDFGRTWIVGRDPTPRQQAQFERWREIMTAVLDVTSAGATAADLGRAATAANGGSRPWLPHFYLGHGIGVNAAEMPMIGTDLGDEFDENFVLQPGMVLVLEPVVWEDGTGGYRSEEVVVITEEGWITIDRLPLRPLWQLKSCPTIALSARGAGQRALAQMAAHDLDVLVLGRQANVRYVTGAPQLWVAGTRPFGPTCVLVRATGAVHLLSTWDEGVPDDIPHENLYGISWNPMNTIAALQAASTARRPPAASEPTRCHRFSRSCCRRRFPTPSWSTGNSPCAPPGGSRRPRKWPRCARRSRWPSRAWPPRWPSCSPGSREQTLAGVLLEALAAGGVSTPSNQDVAWVTSRDHPWRRATRRRPRRRPVTWWPSPPGCWPAATSARWAAPGPPATSPRAPRLCTGAGTACGPG